MAMGLKYKTKPLPPTTTSSVQETRFLRSALARRQTENGDRSRCGIDASPYEQANRRTLFESVLLFAPKILGRHKQLGFLLPDTVETANTIVDKTANNRGSEDQVEIMGTGYVEMGGYPGGIVGLRGCEAVKLQNGTLSETKKRTSVSITDGKEYVRPGVRLPIRLKAQRVVSGGKSKYNSTSRKGSGPHPLRSNNRDPKYLDSLSRATCLNGSSHDGWQP
ncbi:hypothetical protein H072_8587 [Dactylellina haptotyla CBS 200.50]|uniref:Uncharacterized protein n=1 Tax=Dactylellina haptotyla (strain CBS 200.50) TaxID=1284197 RepID=S8BR16_DACHA|nr:hypothetical protein H072_8587 [Dactylellina haptotyla CBS 200.50]